MDSQFIRKKKKNYKTLQSSRTYLIFCNKVSVSYVMKMEHREKVNLKMVNYSGSVYKIG